MMRRREFLFTAAAMAAFPLGARAQSGKIPRVGVLMLGSPDPAFFLREFREGLRELGYIEGRNNAGASIGERIGRTLRSPVSWWR